MASQGVIALWMFFVLVGVAMTTEARSMVQYLPITDFDNGEVQFLGKFAVEVYNNKGESYLYFIEVVNGTVISLQWGGSLRIWELEVKASNCSQSGAPPGLYNALVYENMFQGEGVQTQAYGSKFTSFGVISPV